MSSYQVNPLTMAKRLEQLAELAANAARKAWSFDSGNWSVVEFCLALGLPTEDAFTGDFGQRASAAMRARGPWTPTMRRAVPLDDGRTYEAATYPFEVLLAVHERNLARGQ